MDDQKPGSVGEEKYIYYHEQDKGSNMFIGLILVTILLFVLIYYGLPIVKSVAQRPTDQINVLPQVGINVHQPGKPQSSLPQVSQP